MSNIARIKQVAWIAIVLILTSTRSQIPVSTVNWKATTITSQRFSNRNGEVNETDSSYFSTVENDQTLILLRIDSNTGNCLQLNYSVIFSIFIVYIACFVLFNLICNCASSLMIYTKLFCFIV